MPQEDVLNILEKAKKPLGRKDIAKLLSIDVTIASKLINKLVRWGEVKAMELNKEQARKIYNCRRRMMVYYVSID